MSAIRETFHYAFAVVSLHLKRDVSKGSFGEEKSINPGVLVISLHVKRHGSVMVSSFAWHAIFRGSILGPDILY